MYTPVWERGKTNKQTNKDIIGAFEKPVIQFFRIKEFREIKLKERIFDFNYFRIATYTWTSQNSTVFYSVYNLSSYPEQFY